MGGIADVAVLEADSAEATSCIAQSQPPEMPLCSALFQEGNPCERSLDHLALSLPGDDQCPPMAKVIFALIRELVIWSFSTLASNSLI